MDASQVSCIKMRSLLFGVLLGLLAVVHSSPAHTTTHIHNNAEDEVIREAATDGFLVDHLLLPSGAPESPSANLTGSLRPTSGPQESDAAEGSAGEAGDVHATSVSLRFEATADARAPSSAATQPPPITDYSSSDQLATQSPRSSSTSAPNEARPGVTPDHLSTSKAADHAVSTFGFLSNETSASGSGDGEMFGPYATASTTSGSATETSAASSSSGAPLSRRKVPEVFAESKGSGDGSGEESGSGLVTKTIQRDVRMFNPKYGVSEPNVGTPNDAPASSRAGGTPGWMIITGFIVGLAALVVLLVAIATRERWNGPPQAAQLEGKSYPSDQRRELEMETFLHKEGPKENGHASEYTVVPLEELSE
uniref:Uncharacterized protein n=1 Tax=Gasterosteus aculeatus TaxID=69293 RepID=G3PYC6_GASAC|nr:uncharacterized protein LOC120807754 [Gasterosteus aculeatus aculeatus]